MRISRPLSRLVGVWRDAIGVLGTPLKQARLCLQFAFEQLALHEVVSFTSALNERSIRVMQRLGMTRDPADDFDHPNISDGPLRRHVLYRIERGSWRANS